MCMVFPVCYHYEIPANNCKKGETKRKPNHFDEIDSVYPFCWLFLLYDNFFVVLFHCAIAENSEMVDDAIRKNDMHEIQN